MLFWITAFLLTLAITAILATAIMGKTGNTPAQSGAASDIGVYRDQLREIERDLARGTLTESEAEAVRTEVSRRLLDADKRSAEAAVLSNAARWPGVALVSGVMLCGAYLLYTNMGAPGYPDLPIADRLDRAAEQAANRPGQEQAEADAAPNMPNLPEPDAQFLELMDRLRATLLERPDDLRGLMLLARNEAQLGNFPAARQAQMRVLDLMGDQATETDYILGIDIMIFGAAGYVSPEAEALITTLLTRFPGSAPGRYYSGLTLWQNGRADLAFPLWRRLLEQSPPDAPWVPIIRRDIPRVAAEAGIRYTPPRPIAAAPRLPGPTEEDMDAAQDMSAEDRQAMIETMVTGLAERLATQGGSAEEWSRLIVALSVLGRTEQATAIAAEAFETFAGDEPAIEMIRDAAGSAGLSP